MKQVVAAIFTYNRLALLQRALQVVKNQISGAGRVLVIDNVVTDETWKWLEVQENIEVVTLFKNTGASGGFYTGIKSAAAYNPDWLWIMDDDTICQPDTLANLLNKTKNKQEAIGFIGSRCKWRDGEPNLMNVPDIRPKFLGCLPFNKYDNDNILLIASSSWVSVLISMEAIRKVGLPYREFFFWSDDLEYTQRITKAGFLGCYCRDSVVLHDTYKITVRIFIKRMSIIYGNMNTKVLMIRKDHQSKFIILLLKSAWKSLFFNPVIDLI